MQEIKKVLYQKCIGYADERISSIEKALQASHEASVNDTKSSAGDKYETTREMMQQEISRNAQQLMEAKKLRMALDKFSPEATSDMIKQGSLVVTSGGDFYISISAGQVMAVGRSVYAISAHSPIGRLMMGRKAGDSIEMNKKIFSILQVY
ncbi:3-oxoacyl-ACP synthase [Arcticibacter sp.]|uniref:3-oxoacyl-ACP synthase n=1 Tax=Arcticibacter sp. TaxID=1872630 RepID=UPI00388F63C5